MSAVISVNNLSKLYRIGAAEAGPYRTFRESITSALGGPLRKLRSALGRGAAAADPSTDLWALKDVSFDVKPGEVIGVIGRNGAGKSTLLKILSRITQPTGGSVNIRGRVGSLLEVGTGFHPELTGRENIFLNGAILGMRRKEIDRKFDEIVAFSEVERFLDTPVKRYSSGMYTRLAFAVASHLEPEVLIVDEVLAVGDAAFQKKCLGRMNEVSREGRTVLFVSHNMPAVKSLCSRGVLLEDGRVAYDGSVDEVVDRYLRVGSEMARTGVIPAEAPRLSDVAGEARFLSVKLLDSEGGQTSEVYFGSPLRVQVECELLRDMADPHFEISVSTTDGTHITCSTTIDGGASPRPLKAGRYEISAELDVVLLPREYSIDLGVHHQDGRTSDFVQGALQFTVMRVADGAEGHYPWRRTRGHVQAPAHWQLRAG